MAFLQSLHMRLQNVLSSCQLSCHKDNIYVLPSLTKAAAVSHTGGDRIGIPKKEADIHTDVVDKGGSIKFVTKHQYMTAASTLC